MSPTSFSLVTAMAAITVLPIASATAVAQPRDAYFENAITVTGPHVRHVGRSSIGAPIAEMTVQSVVYFDDLDLRTRNGRSMLDARVETAADEACRTLDANFPPDPTDTPSSLECRGDAFRRAQNQVELAIANAR